MVDADSDDNGVAGELDAVTEQGAELQLGEVAGHELAEGGAGPGHEPTGHGGLGGPGPPHLTNRLETHLAAAGGQPVKHPLGGHLGEEIVSGERRPGGQGELLAGGGADPLAVDRDLAPGEHHRGALHRVAVGHPVGGVPALRTHQGGDVLLQQGAEHLQARPHGEGQEPLLGSVGQLGQRDLDLLRQLDIPLPGFAQTPPPPALVDRGRPGALVYKCEAVRNKISY